MTKINKIVMHGFKSFGKRTELLFNDDFNVVLGPNGSGKCLVASSDVQMADGNIQKIGELVENKVKTNPTKNMDDGVMAFGDGTEVLCLDTKTLRIKRKKVQAFIKRTSPNQLVRVATRSGKKVIATEYHPFFTIKDKAIHSVNAENLSVGTRIAMPRYLNIGSNNLVFTELLNLINEKNSIYVPYKEEFKDILISIKQEKQWKDIAKLINISLNSIKGLLDKQSINFAYLVKILRHANLKDNEIINLITHIKAKNSSITYPMPWRNSPEFSRFFGYLLAEGRITESNQIWFTNGTDEIVEDYISLVNNLFNINPLVREYKPNCRDVIFYSVPLQKILEKMGMSYKGTGSKTIEGVFLKNSSEKELAELLNGLYCGDGYVSNNSIELVTKSESLSRAVETILLRLGILSRTKEIYKIATNTGFRGKYYSIAINAVDNHVQFFRHIQLIHKEKNERVRKLIHKVSNPNVDLIEINSLIKDVSEDLSINIKKTKKIFPKIDAYCYNQCTPSRRGINELLEEVFIPEAESQGLVLKSLAKVELIAKSDIFWDEIIEIEKIKSEEKWVYDLCVEDDHNFIANNFIVHNSNVLDALCFVLGKGSAKGLRAEKSANLVYNGGKSKKPAPKGEVSIFFDNTNKKFPTEDDFVKISRIVKKSGQSLYKINDKSRTRQQILDLLSVAKINPDGYNIILQGDIVGFTEMPTVERRQLIEEISGISVYEDKKKKAVSELEKVDARLNEADIILTERNTYLRELKKDRDQALKYKEMNDKVRQNEASYLKLQIDKNESEKKGYEDKISKEQEELDKINKKVEELRKENEEKKNEMETISKEIEEKGEIGQVKLNRDVEALKISITRDLSRKDTCKSELEKLKARKESLIGDIKETDNKIKSLKIRREDYSKKIEGAKNEKNEIEARLKKFKQKHKLDEAGEIEKEMEEIDKKAEELQKEINGLMEKQHSALREKDRLEHQISTIDEKLEKVKSVEKEYKEQINALKKQREEFTKTTLDLNKRLDEDSSLSIQINKAKEKLTSSTESLERLQARNAGIRESLLSNVAVKKIIEQKNKIRGIYGTVSELGQVSSKHALALEIAAGPRMNSIIVEDDKVASECINYLKKNKLGTAVFLPLNKVKAAAMKPELVEIADKDGCHGMAIDLISFDSKFKRAFQYVFSNTIVVDSIDVARKLGIGKAKMVTLDGDMAELSGVMHGGYRERKKRSYGFSEKEVNKDIEEYEEIVKNMMNTLEVLGKRRQENEATIERLRNFKANLEGEIIKNEKSLHLEHGDLGLNIQEKDRLANTLNEIESNLLKLTQDITKCTKELTDVKIKKEQIRAKINELRNPTLIAELRTFDERKGKLQEEIITFNSEINNIDIQIKDMHSAEIEKIKQVLKQIDKDYAGFEEELKGLEQGIKNQQVDLKDKEKKAHEFYQQFKGLFDKRNKLNEEVNKNDILKDKKKDSSREIEIRLNTISLKKAEVSAKLAGLLQEFEQYHGVELDLKKTEEQLRNEINKFKKMRENVGSINMKALEIYDEVEKEYNKLLDKKASLGKEKEDVVKLMNEIEGKKKELFMQTFDVVNKNFKEIFDSLSTKGNAYLYLENEENPFEGGVRINVKISSDKFLDIRSLSGGEKTMTALAFIFAIQEHEPASFYVLDEVDAALDKHNSEKLAKLIKKYSERAQYIMISHNDAVISEGSNLYGVSMDEHGVSNVVSLKI